MVGTNGSTIGQYEDTIELLTERLQDLELAIEDVGWQRMGSEGGSEFSRDAIRKIAGLARLFYLANPLINRAVSLCSYYTFGQGINIAARHPDVDAVVQAFLDDEKNRAELTSHQARTGKEVALEIEGNIFFVLFTTRATGRVRVRTLPVDEVDDIICDPEDAKSPWFYKRIWIDHEAAPGATQERVAYYPDWRHQPKSRQARIGDHEVRWDTPVYHVKVGGLPDMRFGVPETYAAHDWARAYKVFLEDTATLMRSYARFAHRITNLKGKAGVAAAKSRMGTTYGTGGGGETNPAPLTGSVFLGADGTSIEPLQLRGASVDPEDGRRLLLMVCAAMGLPESFLGDVSVGTLATAKSLDRPTEMKFRDRQALWIDVYQHILNYAVKQAIKAPRGTLQGTVTVNDDGEEIIELGEELDLISGEMVPIDPSVDVDFPPILEHDVDAAIAAIVNAATLGGHPLAGTMTAEQAARLLFTALGQDDIDNLMDEAFPPDEEDVPEEDVPAGDGTGTTTAKDGANEVPATEAKRKPVRRVKGRGKALATVPRATVTPKDLRASSDGWDELMGGAADGLLDAVPVAEAAHVCAPVVPPVVNVAAPVPDPALGQEIARLADAVAGWQPSVAPMPPPPVPDPPRPYTVRREVERDEHGEIIRVVEHHEPKVES